MRPIQEIMSPIFIVGVGRSGTSLLQSMLASHSALSFLPETAFIRRYIVKKRLEKCTAKFDLSAASKIIAEDQLLSRIAFKLPSLSEVAKTNLDLDYYIKIQQLGMANNEKKRFGDKDPRLIEYLPALYHYFSNAYVINIVRDPRDVLVSKKKAAWSSGRSTLFYAFANRVQLRIARNFGKRLFGSRYIEIVYEDLICEPETQLRDLCLNLGLTFEEGLLSFGEQAKKLVSKNEESWKKETFGPLLTGNSDKWKNELSQKEIALIELSCSDAFSIGGYSRSKSLKKLPILSAISVVFSYSIIATFTPIYSAFRYLTQIRTKS